MNKNTITYFQELQMNIYKNNITKIEKYQEQMCF